VPQTAPSSLSRDVERGDDMNITKRDIADIVLVWMAISFLLALLTSIVTLGTWIGMTDEANKFTDKSVAVVFQLLHILVLLFLNYILLFKRSLILSLIVPDGREKNVSIPPGLSVLASYSFWIRLLGIFTFLTSGISFFSHLVMDVATHHKFITGTYWMLQSGTALLSALLAIVVIWKADWIAKILGKLGSSNKVPAPTSAQ
jgi:hypothetical protein